MPDTIVTSAGATGATENDVISSIVQDELDKAAKLRPTIKDVSSMIGKGDKSLDMPKYDTSFTAPQPQNPDGSTTVDFQSPVLGVDTLNLNDWVNLPYRIPDRVSKQSRVNLETELAASAGRKMGIYMDDQIIVQLRLASAATPDHLRGLDGTATAGAGVFGLGTISTADQLLNEQNIEEGNRWMVIPPAQKKTLIDLDDFHNADRYGSREALITGEIGNIYGFRTMVHNGLAANEAFFYHKDCVAVAVQTSVEFETQRADVRLKATDYSFALGMGQTVLQDGKLQVYCLGA